jgi:formate hydrogenlyase subunit 4
MESVVHIGTLLLSVMFLPVGAPLFVGAVRKVAAIMSGRSGSPITQPYAELRKAFLKDPRLPEGSSELLAALSVILITFALVVPVGIPVFTIASPIPLNGISAPFFTLGLSGVLAFLGATVFLRFTVRHVAGESVRATGREGIVGEALSLGVFFFALFPSVLIAQSTDFFGVAEFLADTPYYLAPPLMLGLLALSVGALGPAASVFIAQSDSPAIGRLSGKSLGYVRLAEMIVFLVPVVLAVNLFFPFRLSTDAGVVSVLVGLVVLLAKLIVAVPVLAVLGLALARLSPRALLGAQSGMLSVALLSSVLFLIVYV